MRGVTSLQILLLFLFVFPATIFGQNLRAGAVDPVDEFAARLSASKADDERNSLLAAHGDLVNIRLRRALIQKGNVLLTAGQYAKAFDTYQLAKRVAEQISDQEGVATAILDIGTVYYLQANLDAALTQYQKARDLFAEIPNNYEAARALSGVALIYKERRRDA